MLIQPAELSNTRFLEEQDNFQYFAAADTTICVGAYDAEYQVCHIKFSKRDGSIFVSTPYSHQAAGIVSRVEVLRRNGPPYTLNLKEHGRVTTHKVKLSHHPDGRTHFSQSNRIRSEIGRSSFRLTGVGTLFQLNVYGPAGFDAMKRAAARTKRLYLHYKFRGQLPAAIAIFADWLPMADLAANAKPPGAKIHAINQVFHRPSGTIATTTFLRPPQGWPLRDHLMLVRCEPTLNLTNLISPTEILFGGLDPHEVEGESQVEQSGCLVGMYPAANVDALMASLGTVDLPA